MTKVINSHGISKRKSGYHAPQKCTIFNTIKISEGKHSKTRKDNIMSNTRPVEYQFSAVTTINWALDENDLRNLGDDIEQVINSWLEGAIEVNDGAIKVNDGAEIPVTVRQEMLRVIVNFMCSDKFEWAKNPNE